MLYAVDSNIPIIAPFSAAVPIRESCQTLSAGGTTKLVNLLTDDYRAVEIFLLSKDREVTDIMIISFEDDGFRRDWKNLVIYYYLWMYR